MGALYKMTVALGCPKRLLAVLACGFFAYLPSGCTHRQDSGRKRTSLPEIAYGEWVVTSIIVTTGRAPKSEYEKRYEGKAIRITPDVFDCILFAVEKPRYVAEEVRHSHEEGEVPSRAFKRTSAFGFYEQERKVVHVIWVYDQNGDGHGMVEFVKEKGQIVVTVDRQCLLIAERKTTLSK